MPAVKIWLDLPLSLPSPLHPSLYSTNWVFPNYPCTSLPWQFHATSSLATGHPRTQGAPQLVPQPSLRRAWGLPLQVHPHTSTQEAMAGLRLTKRNSGWLGRTRGRIGSCVALVQRSPGEPGAMEVVSASIAPPPPGPHSSLREIVEDHLAEVGSWVDVRLSCQGLSRKVPRNPESDLLTSPATGHTQASGSLQDCLWSF